MSGRSPYDAAHDAALRLLAHRPRTEREIRDRLGRTFPEDVAAEVVAALRSQGLLDDAQFSRQWAESRSARNPRSARMIVRELRAKGVDGALADDAAVEVDDDDSAYRACLKYARIGGQPDGTAFQRRLLGYLARRGFSQSVSRRAIERLMNELAAAGGERPEGAG